MVANQIVNKCRLQGDEVVDELIKGHPHQCMAMIQVYRRCLLACIDTYHQVKCTTPDPYDRIPTSFSVTINICRAFRSSGGSDCPGIWTVAPFYPISTPWTFELATSSKSVKVSISPEGPAFFFFFFFLIHFQLCNDIDWSNDNIRYKLNQIRRRLSPAHHVQRGERARHRPESSTLAEKVRPHLRRPHQRKQSSNLRYPSPRCLVPALDQVSRNSIFFFLIKMIESFHWSQVPEWNSSHWNSVGARTGTGGEQVFHIIGRLRHSLGIQTSVSEASVRVRHRLHCQSGISETSTQNIHFAILRLKLKIFDFFLPFFNQKDRKVPFLLLFIDLTKNFDSFWPNFEFF